MEIKKIAAEMRTTAPAIRGRVTRLGLSKKRVWTPAETASLVELYTAAGAEGFLNLNAFAAAMGRGASNVSTKAREIGLPTGKNRKCVESRKERVRKFGSDEDLRKHISERTKRFIKENGHPRGALGMKHTAETLAIMSEKSKAKWASLSPEERDAHIAKMMASRVANGYAPPAIARGTWKAGWREVGAKRNFYRSRWEANYARYLEWLKQHGEIAEWKHEPETFWFEAIKRGVRSYKPDFRVWEHDGSSALHEVKGWMDGRSRTCLRRMAKYYPQERIVLIDGRQYRAIRLKVMRLIEGWEDHERDSHA
jgi:hypothetical protein